MYETSEAIGRRVRGLLAERLMSQKAAAQSIGMTQQALSSRVRGRTAWSIDELVALGHVLGVELVTLAHETAPALRPVAS